MLDSNATSQLKEAQATIQEIPCGAGDDQPRHSLAAISWIACCMKQLRGWMLNFFPWIGQPRLERLDRLHKRKSFPWLGFSCLLISLTTVIFTFLIFFFINHHPEFLGKYVKPASWLSVIVSVNSIALHIALNEGVSNAWWYRASRSDVTMQELHETYLMGTSTVAVLLSGKKFNYVAMAAIFVATIPLNGFLLQNAINIVPSSEANGTHLYVPVVTRLPLGFSADLLNATVPEASELLETATASFDGANGVPPGFSYDELGSYELMGCVSKEDASVCKGNVTIAGFNIQCKAWMAEAYDLQPSSNPNGVTATVFSQNITWNPQQPEVIGLDMLYKPNQTCSGQYERRSCQFPIAMMNMTVQINSDKGYTVGFFYDDSNGWNTSLPVISLDAMATTRSAFNYSGELPPYPAEGQQNSTYGGIAQWLGQRYNASIEWTYSGGSWQVQKTGLAARSHVFLEWLYLKDNITGLPDDGYSTNGTFIGNAPLPFTPKPDNETWCRNVYLGLDWVTESSNSDGPGILPEDSIYVTLNDLMLSASVAEFNSELSNNVTFWNTLSNASTEAEYDRDQMVLGRSQYYSISDAKQYTDIGRYEIRWGYYGGSVAVTVSIILMITPLFYGFWWLERRQTLSPFETAAAFQAPGFEGIDRKVKVDEVLREIGRRPVHMHTDDSDTSLSPASNLNRSMSTPALR